MTALKNQFQKARIVLQSLAYGLHPVTGDELPREGVVNDIEVNRAMSTAVIALDQMIAKLIRREALPEKVGKGWTEEEVRQLKDEFNGDESLPLIARKHGRTLRAIEARLESLGLLAVGTRRKNSSFVVSPARKEKGK